MNISILKQIVVLRKRSIIVIAILFAVALALQFFIKLYQSPSVEKLQAEAMQLRELEGRGAALLDRETLYRNGLADLAKFREKVYPKSQFARFIGELFEMASKNGLELTSITYKPSLSKEDQLLNYALTLSVSGKYSQLKKFIYDLGAGSSNILVIDSIAMTASGATAESVQLQLSITSWFKMEAQ
jgi:Tfp pilus assembly protein PilO